MRHEPLRRPRVRAVAPLSSNYGFEGRRAVGWAGGKPTSLPERMSRSTLCEILKAVRKLQPPTTSRRCDGQSRRRGFACFLIGRGGPLELPVGMRTWTYPPSLRIERLFCDRWAGRLPHRRSESGAICGPGSVPTPSRRAWDRTGLSVGMSRLFDAYAAEVKRISGMTQTSRFATLGILCPHR